MSERGVRAAVRGSITALAITLAALVAEPLLNAVAQWVMLGLMVAADGLLVTYVWRQTGPEKTPERPSTARDRWEAARRRRQ